MTEVVRLQLYTKIKYLCFKTGHVNDHRGNLMLAIVFAASSTMKRRLQLVLDASSLLTRARPSTRPYLAVECWMYHVTILTSSHHLYAQRRKHKCSLSKSAQPEHKLSSVAYTTISSVMIVFIIFANFGLLCFEYFLSVCFLDSSSNKPL